MAEFRLMIVVLLLVTILAILGQGKTWHLKAKAVPGRTALAKQGICPRRAPALASQ